MLNKPMTSKVARTRRPARTIRDIENRKSARNVVNLSGEVGDGNRYRRMNCRVIDMSATGARIMISSDERRQMNNRIALYLDHMTTNVECEIIWMNQDEFGVRFCSPFHSVRESV